MFSFSRKPETDFVLGSAVTLCHLCFARACDCGRAYFCQNYMSMSSNVCLSLALMLLKVCKASLWRYARKWLIFIASDISSCVFSIVWKRPSNSSISSFFPSKNNVFFMLLAWRILMMLWSLLRCNNCNCLRKSVRRVAWVWVLSMRCFLNNWQCVVEQNM